MKNRKISETIRAARQLLACLKSHEQQWQQVCFLENEAVHELKTQHEKALETTQAGLHRALIERQISQLATLYQAQMASRRYLRQRFAQELALVTAPSA